MLSEGEPCRALDGSGALAQHGGGPEAAAGRTRVIVSSAAYVMTRA